MDYIIVKLLVSYHIGVHILKIGTKFGLAVTMIFNQFLLGMTHFENLRIVVLYLRVVYLPGKCLRLL